MAAILALAGATAPVAGAATLNPGGSFDELTERQAETTTTSSTPTRVANEPTNSHTTILLALGAAVVLLSGIAFVIVRDARRVAPASDGELIDSRSARSATLRLQRRRAKAKAARRQRKRNR